MYNTVIKYNILKHNLDTNGCEHNMYGESFCTRTG